MSEADPWGGVVARTMRWLEMQQVNPRDAIVLLPFAQLIPVARRAFGASAVWIPRVETTQSLARSLGPAERPGAGQPSFDIALDRLVVEAMLRQQAWASTWSQLDPHGFALAVAEVVQTAHLLARAAFSLQPDSRPAYWEAARESLAIQHVLPGSPGARERMLGRIALEWAATAPAPVTDALFHLQPAAWIVLQAGGPDAFAANLLQHAAAAIPCLWIDADPDPAQPFDALPPQVQIDISSCADFETEAQRCAALVLGHLQRGRKPVALIAQDRELVRRVRALLARQPVAIKDETGWTLSTTRAGASVRALMTCATDDSSTDDWLDWLKACNAPSAGQPAALAQALDDLEVALRTRKVRAAGAVDAAALPPRAAELWRRARAALRPLTSLGRATGKEWLIALDACLRASGQHAALDADDAGRQVIEALHLPPAALSTRSSLAAQVLDLSTFSAWLDAALEEGTFLPDFNGDADVVIAPLARAMLRPFAATVLPGADEKHLGAVPSPQGLLGDAECAALGLPDRVARQRAELFGFVQLLRSPNLSLLHRTTDDREPRALSPWVELLRLALRRANMNPPGGLPEGRVAQWVHPTPIDKPLPTAPELLPARLSASACESLRTCPYQFFALRMLKLGSLDELDVDLEKREYGTWLHAVLQRFHAERAEQHAAPTETGSPLLADGEVETHRLREIAREVLADLRLDEAEFLPYSASFARLVPRYLAWLHARDSGGAKWLEAEVDLGARPPGWNGIEMKGVIDRIDYVDKEGVPTTQLIDYKTGQGQALRDAIELGEDTQLPFYAALIEARGDAPGDIGAMYLALDESQKVLPIPHDDVQASAEMLVEGIGRELARIRAGAPLPALGEGRACEYCDARGLCRRDHWAASTSSAP